MFRLVAALVGALVVVGTAGLVAACGGGTGDAVPDSAGREVVLVTYESFALPERAAAEFERRTGRRIRVVASGDSGSVLAAALLRAGAPDGDVLFGVDDASASRVLSEDLLEPFVAPQVADGTVPESLRLPGELGELLTPIDTGDVCVIADREWFTGRGLAVPSTYEQLTDPAYRDLLVVQSPVTSSPGLAFLVGSIATDEAGWPEYWSRLVDNGVRVRPSWDDAYNNDYTVSGGDRPLVVSYASSPPAEVVFSEGTRSEPASEVVADTCVRQVEYAGVLRGAPDPEGARQLVEFMLSPEWQSELPLTNFVQPVVPGTPLPPEFERFAARPETVLSLPADRVGASREEWVEQWRTIVE
jgi:thiamine transport system substrate-binding protein